MFAVAEVQVNYRKPARLDDETAHHLRAGARGPRVDPLPADHLAAGDVVLTEGEVRVACVDAKTFRPRPLAGFHHLEGNPQVTDGQ